jgi:intron-binding protein aquarius
MNEECAIPEWLHDIFLGYGDPAAAHFTNMPEKDQLSTVTFKDTFLDKAHLEEAFADHTIEYVGASKDDPKPPFKVTFPAKAAPKEEEEGKKRKKKGQAEEAEATEEEVKVLKVESVTPPDLGPYSQDQARLNTVRFTDTQVAAIRAGVNPGLTMVVGPPGTGKTDVAVQIMHELYHNRPNERTLLITHSNHALNDLFSKIMERDIPARYLLRLGMGEQELDTDIDFSRAGRVNAMLARRIELLAEVEKLARTLGVVDDVGYTCETAGHFYLLHVFSRWEEFVHAVGHKRKKDGDEAAAGVVKELFPFSEYFANAPQPIFKGANVVDDTRAARGCFRHMRIMFQELEECRGFELMRNQGDRSNLLLTRQAKIVAMTCTHAAMKRSEFLKVGFKYDNLIMEESAQILEIETFIPMLLQKTEDGRSRLKRVCLIGDHHQLPPVVKNMAFQKYSHMDQSLFTRFVRLGTPTIQLNRQGRARSSLATLYNWRYRDLKDLPRVQTIPAFKAANAGFAHEFQFVDVPDWDGVGESEPSPYFFQNLGEAEYVVTVFQYMRLMGYPAKKISIITTYRGQKHLIRDVIKARCENNPLFGRPAKIATVDKFQGQQNDYILLSLVRTRTVGHFRDVRRLVVSRVALLNRLIKLKEECMDCFTYPTCRHEDVLSIHLLLSFTTEPSCVCVCVSFLRPCASTLPPSLLLILTVLEYSRVVNESPRARSARSTP